MGNSTPCKIVTHENLNMKLSRHDYVVDITHHANFGRIRFSGGFSPNRWNMTLLWLFWLSYFYGRIAKNACIVLKIRVGEHDSDVRFLTGSRNKAILRMRNKKFAIWPIFMGEFAEFPASCKKSGSANTMMTSDFWSKVEILPFRAYAMKKYAIC